MNFENFEEYISKNLKLKDDKLFQEKLDLLLSNDKTKKELNNYNKEKENQLIKEKKLKEKSNEKKIDFILSDENSFEKYEKKLMEKKEQEEDDYNIDNIFFEKFPKVTQNIQNEESSNITNTEYLINNERKGDDIELKKINEDIKKNKPVIYNPKKIKKYKEMKDLKIGLENKDSFHEKPIINKNQSRKENSKTKMNGSNQKNKNVNKDSQPKKLNQRNFKKNIIKEIKKEENDEDLIMSLIQCPVQSCQKSKNNLQNKLIINNLVNTENKNIMEINKSNVKQNKDENESLLNIYKKEKEMKNKLQKIFLFNQNITKDKFFPEENESNSQFYDFDSNSKYLSKANEIILDDLSEEEKRFIKELDEKIIDVKKQISDINKEKTKYNKMIEEKKNEYTKFESEKNKEEFEYERELINDTRSIINKFKMEIYKKELGLNNEDNNDNNQDEAENEEIKKLKYEYNELKNEYQVINKNNEKFIADVQKKIMILKYENEQMKQKIESYQENEIFFDLEHKIIAGNDLSLLNQKTKKNKMFQLDDEEQKITINKDFGLNNIIKTSSKFNHLKELDFEFPEKYFNENDQNNKIIKHQFELDGKTIKIYNNNKKEIIFPNNTRKQIFPDGYTIVYFSNGDIKEIIPNNKEIYYYKKDEVYQINFADGYKYIKYLKTGKIFCDGNAIN